MANEDIMKRVAQLLANKALNDNQLRGIAGAVEGSKYPVIGMDVCTHGIIIDLDVDRGLADIDLSDLLGVATGPVKSLEIFPEGIILDNRARVRLTHGF